MRILLTTLNSKYVHSSLALKCLYASAQKNRRYLDLKEFTINNDDGYIFTELVRCDYDVVCFSCYIWNIDRIFLLGEKLKLAKPDVKIVVGGPEVSFDTVELMGANKWIDFLMSGEGEGTFNRLVDALIADHQQHSGTGRMDLYQTIRGLSYRKDGRLYVNPAAALLKFSSVPFPYQYLPVERDKVQYYESSRGCPFRCAYCLSCLEKKVRPLPVDRVKSDVSYFIYRKVKQVKFLDRTFNWNPARCLEILSYLAEHDNGITNFHFELCGDLIDEGLISLMRRVRPGLFQFEIGIQSTNEKVLEACNRNRDSRKLFHMVERLIACQTAEVHLDLIAGLPHEDFFSFRRSFNGVYRLRPHMLQLGFLKLLKGTPLRAEASRYGYVYDSRAPYEVISNRYLSAAGVARLKMIEHVVDLYYNRKGFEQSLEFSVRCLGDTAFDFFEEFAIFFYLKGFRDRSHSKENLYRIFYQYGQWKNRKDLGSAEELPQLLLSDMERTLNPDAVKKFQKKGWELEL